MKKVIV